MTIGIGILCKDGIVFASDGMCSAGPVGVDNLKTHIVKDRIVFCCAGADNYLQFFLNFLNLKFNEFQFDVPNRTADNIISSIVNGFYTYISALMVVNIPPHTQNILLQRLQNDFLSQPSQFQAIVGFFHNSNFYLYRIEGLTPSPIKPTGMWYTIIGSGFFHGMPSIHLIKKITNKVIETYEK